MPEGNLNRRIERVGSRDLLEKGEKENKENMENLGEGRHGDE